MLSNYRPGSSLSVSAGVSGSYNHPAGVAKAIKVEVKKKHISFGWNFSCCLVRSHPAAFRLRFEEEMLWIFDQAQSARSLYRLVMPRRSTIDAADHPALPASGPKFSLASRTTPSNLFISVRSRRRPESRQPCPMTSLYVLRANLMGELEWPRVDGTTSNIRGADLWQSHRLSLTLRCP